METNSTCPDSTCKLRNNFGYCSSNGPCIRTGKTVKMPEKEITKTGLEQIVVRILNMTVQPPQDKTCHELSAWLQGYAECQNRIFEIIGQVTDGMR